MYKRQLFGRQPSDANAFGQGVLLKGDDAVFPQINRQSALLAQGVYEFRIKPRAALCQGKELGGQYWVQIGNHAAAGVGCFLPGLGALKRCV